MNFLKFYSILGLSVLFVLSACNKDEPTDDPNSGTDDPTVEVETPVITLDQMTLNVAVEGEVVSVSYQVENPVDGATVTVDKGDVTWITDITVTDSTIDLTVEANSEDDSRTATLTVSYPGAEDVSLTVVQEGVQYDYNFEAIVATATYYTNSGDDKMKVDIVFTNMELDEYGFVIPPGISITLEACMPYDADGKIATGTYTVTDTNNSMTISPGYYSYMLNYETTNTSTEYEINSGTMTVTADAEDDNYVIVCDFVTLYGITVKCTYKGYLIVKYMPGNTSTLTENIEVEIGSNVSATAYSFGNFFGNGGKNWAVEIIPYGSGQALQLDLNAEWKDSSEGIPSGTYTASSSTTAAVGEYLYGYLDYYIYYGTWYLEIKNGYTVGMAPAVDGNIIITNNGENNYTIKLDCKDDRGYTWSGEWTGNITIDTSFESLYPYSSTSSSKSSVISKFSKQEMSVKAAEKNGGKGDPKYPSGRNI